MAPYQADTTIDPEAFTAAVTLVMSAFASPAVRAAALAMLSSEERADWAAAFHFIAEHLEAEEGREPEAGATHPQTRDPLSPWMAFARIGHA
jgi:hypothetical protein